MLKIFSNIIGFLRTSSSGRGMSNKRAYEAGRITRHSYDWIPSSRSINADIREGKRRIRDRANDLKQNNPYINGYRILSRVNIVGHEGFTLQVRARLKNGEYDDEANRLIEEQFEEWCEPEYCTMSGRYHFIMVQWMVAEQMKFEGEFLVRKIENLNTSINPFGFALEMLDPADLDENLYKDLGNGRAIIMGVELDEWRRIHAYHFRKKSITDDLTGNFSQTYDNHIRIDANEIIYGFDPEHPKQVRGMTKLSAIMISLKDVDRWEDASIKNATISAMKMGFLEEIAENAEPYSGGKEVDKSKGGRYMDLEAGIIEKLPFGNKFSSFDPKFPHEQHQPFLKSMLRKLATGLGLSYNSWANDLESVNYSSMRSGLLNERDNWMCDQTLFKLMFLKLVYKAFLKNAIMTKAVNLPYASLKNYLKHNWQGRRWPWVDPRADVEANILAVKAGFKTPTQVIAEMGNDTEDTYKEFARVARLQLKYGLEFDLGGSERNKTAQDSNADNADDQQSKSDGTGRNLIKLVG